MACTRVSSGQGAKPLAAATSDASPPLDASVLSIVADLEGHDLNGLRRHWRARLGGEPPTTVIAMRIMIASGGPRWTRPPGGRRKAEGRPCVHKFAPVGLLGGDGRIDSADLLLSPQAGKSCQAARTAWWSGGDSNRDALREALSGGRTSFPQCVLSTLSGPSRSAL